MSKEVRGNGIQPPPGIERFIRLGKRIGDDSRELAVKLIHLIRGYGIYKMTPSMDDKSNHVPFLSAVHDGWKLAQNLVADKLIENLTKLEELEQAKKEYHRQHLKNKKDETISKIKTLKLENLIFRRFIDSIVWAMLYNEHSTIRRLPMNKSGDNLSIKNIEDARSTVDELNNCPLTIAIISDITTFVHHGDIVVKSPSGITFVELKSGEKGKAITRTAETIQELNCAIASEILTRNFNTKDKNQYTRTQNQLERGKNLSNTLRTGIGNDPFTGLKLKIGESKVKLDFYSDELVLCRKRLEENGSWALSVIDNCLYVGMYKQLEFAYPAFTLWMQGIECKSQIYNITDSFYDALSRPLPSLEMPTDFILEILNGDIIMVACLNIEEFYALSQTMYPNMLTLTKPPNLIGLEEMLINGKALTMTIGDGLGKGYLADGLITRMAYDLQTPSSILKMKYASSDRYYYLEEPKD
ncbi:hypothetical protein ACX3YC_04305 [Pseudomonas mohnii]